MDFILGDAQVAIEVKIQSEIHAQELKGLIAFQEAYSSTNPRCVVVCQAARERWVSTEQGQICIQPWKKFLSELWTGKYYNA